ncbi:phosphotransferase [Kineosporia babensis]|uniref:Phosphotransferase n=1 Tax=Kineosporia babensis TaxID=499548 RepID=A0A9X1SWL2_9ACTN|nr:phosphotransferase [Kineosporia babensis]MCD5314906.1 phosphotransferase [Kineosporia babensis]
MNSDLARRDPELTALPMMLEDDLLASWVSGAVGSPVVLRRKYLRYKRHTAIVVTAAVDDGPAGLPRELVVWHWADGGRPKLDKLCRKAPAGAVLHVDAAAGLVLGTPAADRHLPGLAAVLGGEQEVRTLSFKPGRRWVGSVGTADGGRQLVRVYPPRDLARFSSAARGLAGSGAPVAALLGTRAPGGASFEWVPGRALELPLTARDARDLGAVVGQLHRTPVALLPPSGTVEGELSENDSAHSVSAPASAGEAFGDAAGRPEPSAPAPAGRGGPGGASRLPVPALLGTGGPGSSRTAAAGSVQAGESAALEAVSAALNGTHGPEVPATVALAAWLVPDLASRLRRLARIAQNVDLSGGPQVVLHGDLSADQVVRGPDGRLTLIDLDRVRIGPAADDLGCLAASVLLEKGSATDVLREFGTGYGPLPDEAAIRAWTLVHLLARSTEAFRTCRPDWPDQVRHAVEAAEELAQEEVYP